MKVRVEGREKKVRIIKRDPGGKEEAMLCPCYARLEGEERGRETRWDLRHCWHNTADDQQNGLLAEGGEIK